MKLGTLLTLKTSFLINLISISLAGVLLLLAAFIPRGLELIFSMPRYHVFLSASFFWTITVFLLLGVTFLVIAISFCMRLAVFTGRAAVRTKDLVLLHKDALDWRQVFGRKHVLKQLFSLGIQWLKAQPFLNKLVFLYAALLFLCGILLTFDAHAIANVPANAAYLTLIIIVFVNLGKFRQRARGDG